MKKVATLYCCLLVLLTLISCDNEPVDFDVSVLSFNPRILGQWQLVEFNSEVSYIPGDQDQSSVTETRVFNTATDLYIIFDDDDLKIRGDYTYNVRVKIDGIEQTSNFYTNSDVDEIFDYTLKNNELSIEEPFFKITTHEPNTIHLLEGQTHIYEISENGETLFIMQDEVLTSSDIALPNGTIIVKRTTSVWTKDFTLFSCALREATREAEIAYNASNQDIQLCLDYRRALEDQILECGDSDGSLNDIINQLGNCGLLSADVLRVTAGLQNIDFANKTISYSNEVISVYGASLFGNHSISFEVPEYVTGIDTFINFIIKVDGVDYFPSYPGVNNFRFNTLISSNFSFNAVFEGTVVSAQGDELTLSVGIVDVNY